MRMVVLRLGVILVCRQSTRRIIMVIGMEAEFFAVSPGRGRAGENHRQAEKNREETFHPIQTVHYDRPIFKGSRRAHRLLMLLEGN